MTLQEAVFPLPSAAFAVTVALPAETAFTVPLDTDTTPESEDVHVTFLFVAFPAAQMP